MDGLPRKIICKAYLVNNMPEKITGDLLTCVADDVGLVNLAFRKDYADLVCDLIGIVPKSMWDDISVVGPAAVAEYGKRGGLRADFWGIAAKCGMKFQVSITVPDNCTPRAPHTFLQNCRVNVTDQGYVATGDGWNFICSVSKTVLMAAVRSLDEFPIGYYDKKFEMLVMKWRVSTSKAKNLTEIYQVLGKSGIIEYVRANNITTTTATKEILDYIAAPVTADTTVTIGEFKLRTDECDMIAMKKVAEFIQEKPFGDEKSDLVCKLMNYLCDIAHICPSALRPTFHRKATEFLKHITDHEADFTVERFKSFAAVINLYK